MNEEINEKEISSCRIEKEGLTLFIEIDHSKAYTLDDLCNNIEDMLLGVGYRLDGEAKLIIYDPKG